MKIKPHIFVFITLLIIIGAGSGYRHLSQDEADTAMRGWTILESGVPKTIDSEGKPVVFAGGREIEEGVVQRYLSVGQFYAASTGILFGRIFGIDQDRAVRLPFVVSHAAVGGLVSYGLTTMCNFSVPASVSFALLHGISTDRLIHNRTTRYHAIMDLLVVIGLFGCAGIRRGKKWGGPLLATSIFLLPQTHTVAGSALSSLFSLTGTAFFFFMPEYNGKRIRNFLTFIFLPGLLSLILALAIIRPWAQDHWGGFFEYRLKRSFNIHKRFMYSYAFFIFSGIFMWVRKNRLEGGIILACTLAAFLVIPYLDRVNSAQYRYYFPLWFFTLLWPLGIGFGNLNKKGKHIILGLMMILVVLPEVSTRRFRPYHGLRMMIDDVQKECARVKQPLHEILDIIKTEGKPGDAVLFDSVPLLSNWYLPNYKVALMPDENQRHHLNDKNPIWDVPLIMPDWHIWYPNVGSGIVSIIESDFKADQVDMNKRTYVLKSNKLNKTVTMCFDQYWRTNQFNNNPIHMYNAVSFSPTGGNKDTLLLGKKCT